MNYKTRRAKEEHGFYHLENDTKCTWKALGFSRQELAEARTVSRTLPFEYIRLTALLQLL